MVWIDGSHFSYEFINSEMRGLSAAGRASMDQELFVTMAAGKQQLEIMVGNKHKGQSRNPVGIGVLQELSAGRGRENMERLWLPYP